MNLLRQRIRLERGAYPVRGQPWKLVQQIGHGGYGSVWEALTEEMGPFALKFVELRGKPFAAAEVRSLRMLREIRHPNLIPIHTSCFLSDNGSQLPDRWLYADCPMPPRNFNPAWFVIQMPLAERNLAEHTEHRIYPPGQPQMPLRELFSYCTQIASVLDHLNHGLGEFSIQHCDVKPSNILLAGEKCVLADLGIARYNSSVATSPNLGTTAYSSPECLRFGQPSAFSDQYSFAITSYKLLTGVLPFRPEDATEPKRMRNAHLKGRLCFDRIDSETALIFDRATALKPTKRFPDSSEFVSQLATRLSNIKGWTVEHERLRPRTRISREETRRAMDDFDISDSHSNVLPRIVIGFMTLTIGFVAYALWSFLSPDSHLPNISSTPPVAPVAVGNEFTYPVEVQSGTEVSDVSMELVDAHGWLGISDSTVSGVPTNAGTYRVAITATNSVGKEDRQEFEIVVIQPKYVPPKPIKFAASPIFLIEGAPATTLLTKTANTLVTAADPKALPNGLSIQNARLAGKPKSANFYEFEIKAKSFDETEWTHSQKIDLVVLPDHGELRNRIMKLRKEATRLPANERSGQLKELNNALFRLQNRLCEFFMLRQPSYQPLGGVRNHLEEDLLLLRQERLKHMELTLQTAKENQSYVESFASLRQCLTAHLVFDTIARDEQLSSTVKLLKMRSVSRWIAASQDSNVDLGEFHGLTQSLIAHFDREDDINRLRKAYLSDN